MNNKPTNIYKMGPLFLDSHLFTAVSYCSSLLKMKPVIILALAALAVSAPVEDGTAIVDQILATIEGKEDLTRVADYLKEYHIQFHSILPTFESDGKTKAAYTFFFPTSLAFIRQTPQDVADPFSLDENFRRSVFDRHFAKQLISSEELAKLDKILMADSKEAVLTIDAGIQKINDAEIYKDAYHLPNNAGIIYVIDKVFMSNDEVKDVLKKHGDVAGAFDPWGLPLNPQATGEEEPVGIRNTPLAPANPVLGGFTTVTNFNDEIQGVAQFAVTALAAQANSAAPPALSLVTITKVEKQVVAGINYRMQLVVKSPSNEAVNCEVLVLDQGWIPNRQLVSFKCDQSLTR